jgi:hypothetical protein
VSHSHIQLGVGFRLSTNSADDENKLHKILQAQAFRTDFCMSHNKACMLMKASMNTGWQTYDPMEDYRRMGLGVQPNCTLH